MKYIAGKPKLGALSINQIEEDFIKLSDTYKIVPETKYLIYKDKLFKINDILVKIEPEKVFIKVLGFNCFNNVFIEICNLSYRCVLIYYLEDLYNNYRTATEQEVNNLIIKEIIE